MPIHVLGCVCTSKFEATTEEGSRAAEGGGAEVSQPKIGQPSGPRSGRALGVQLRSSTGVNKG